MLFVRVWFIILVPVLHLVLEVRVHYVHGVVIFANEIRMFVSGINTFIFLMGLYMCALIVPSYIAFAAT